MDMRNMEVVRMADEDIERIKREFEASGRPSPFVALSDDEARQLAPMQKDQRKAWMRNKKCPCGSGKKFKKCCWGKYDPKRLGGGA